MLFTMFPNFCSSQNPRFKKFPPQLFGSIALLSSDVGKSSRHGLQTYLPEKVSLPVEPVVIARARKNRKLTCLAVCCLNP
jgi:hypothetical protein